MDTRTTLTSISIVCFLANFTYGLTSFGPAIIFQCGWHVASLYGMVEGTIAEVVTDDCRVQPSVLLGHGLIEREREKKWKKRRRNTHTHTSWHHLIQEFKSRVTSHSPDEQVLISSSFAPAGDWVPLSFHACLISSPSSSSAEALSLAPGPLDDCRGRPRCCRGLPCDLHASHDDAQVLSRSPLRLARCAQALEAPWSLDRAAPGYQSVGRRGTPCHGPPEQPRRRRAVQPEARHSGCRRRGGRRVPQGGLRSWRCVGPSCDTECSISVHRFSGLDCPHPAACPLFFLPLGCFAPARLTAGPPMMVLLTHGVSVDPLEWRATSAVAQLALSTAQT